MTELRRRDLLKGAAAGGLAAQLTSCQTIPVTPPRAATDEVRVAVVGLNGRGNSHASELRRLPNVKLVALCDVDEKVLERRKGEYEAKGDTIEKYGTCDTICETDHGMVGCHWQLADVTRPLHSVSQVTGPKDGPGKQDVLFNNRRCVVVPPGVVDEILKKIKPVMEYPREGNLYVADATLSAFRRQGQRP